MRSNLAWPRPLREQQYHRSTLPPGETSCSRFCSRQGSSQEILEKSRIHPIKQGDRRAHLEPRRCIPVAPLPRVNSDSRRHRQRSCFPSHRRMPISRDRFWQDRSWPVGPLYSGSWFHEPASFVRSLRLVETSGAIGGGTGGSSDCSGAAAAGPPIFRPITERGNL